MKLNLVGHAVPLWTFYILKISEPCEERYNVILHCCSYSFFAHLKTAIIIVLRLSKITFWAQPNFLFVFILFFFYVT